MSERDVSVILEKLQGMEDKLDRHDSALFGVDGTGGIVDVVRKIGARMDLIVGIAVLVGGAAVYKLFGA